MTFKNTAAKKAAESEHLFERLGVNAAQTKIGLKIFRALARAGCRGFMETERQIELFEQVPKRLVIPVIPVFAIPFKKFSYL